MRPFLLACFFLRTHAVVVSIFLDASCTTPPPISMGYGSQADTTDGLPPFFTVFADICHASIGGATSGTIDITPRYNGVALEKCTSDEVVIDLFSRIANPMSWGAPRATCATEVAERVALVPGVCTPVTAWRSFAAPQMFWQVSDTRCDPPAPVYTLQLARNSQNQPCTIFRNPPAFPRETFAILHFAPLRFTFNMPPLPPPPPLPRTNNHCFTGRGLPWLWCLRLQPLHVAAPCDLR